MMMIKDATVLKGMETSCGTESDPSLAALKPQAGQPVQEGRRRWSLLRGVCLPLSIVGAAVASPLALCLQTPHALPCFCQEVPR